MKKILFISPIIIALSFFPGSCDYVTSPNDVAPTDSLTFDSTKRVAFIEEWTGHTCVACPAAARDIEDIEAAYGEHFVALSIHAGWFAEPCPPHPLPGGAPTGSFSDDFRCPTGNDYDLIFGGSSSPPMGLVNRLGYPSNALKTRGVWPGLVDSIVQEPALVTIHLDHTYNTSSRALNFTMWGSWLATVTADVNVCVMLTESGIVGWQTDGTTLDSQYTFKHILRECVNTPGSITGSQVATGTSLIGTTYSYTLPSAYTVPSGFDAANCHLVAFIYNTTTNEVLQAREFELTP